MIERTESAHFDKNGKYKPNFFLPLVCSYQSLAHWIDEQRFIETKEEPNEQDQYFEDLICDVCELSHVGGNCDCPDPLCLYP